MVHVFQEGIHTGLLVPAGWLWDGADGVAEVSFGDAAWMSGEERGCAHGMALGLWGGAGAIYLRRIADTAAEAIQRERWQAQAVGLSPDGAVAMRTEIGSWIEPEGHDLRDWVDGGSLRPSPRRFRFWRDCHDQVADCLRAAGVPLAGSWLPWRTRDRFRDEVEAALRELDERGIRWVGPRRDWGP